MSDETIAGPFNVFGYPAEQSVPGMFPRQELGATRQRYNADLQQAQLSLAQRINHDQLSRNAANQLARTSGWLVTAEEAFFRRLIAWGMGRRG